VLSLSYPATAVDQFLMQLCTAQPSDRQERQYLQRVYLQIWSAENLRGPQL